MTDQQPVPRLSPWSEDRERLVDIGLVVALLLPVPVLQLLMAFPGHVAVLSAAQILPLLVRRHHPEACFGLVVVATLAQLPLTTFPVWGQVAMPVAIYSMAAFSSPVRGQAALGVGLVGAVVGPLDWLGNTFRLSLPFLVLFAGAAATIVIAAWALGRLTGTRRAYVAQLIDRSDRIEREARQSADLAASDERARIAREMHDVVAHGLSVMVVQADGARYVVEKDPAAAATALETIAGTGRESLAEMRRLLGLLRTGDGDGTAGATTRPQPGLPDLDTLLAEASGSGMRLTSDVQQPLPAVSAGVGLTVYRVVQEALTNARRHAGPEAQVHVAVRLLRGAVWVSVEDDGRGASAPDDGKGHGMVGMRERVTALGGTLEAGPRPGGGFRVDAHVPLTSPTDREAAR